MIAGWGLIAPPPNPGSVGSADYYRNGAQVLRESMSRTMPLSNGQTPLTSGVMLSVGVVLYAGDVINKIAFRTGTAGFTTLSNHWFALYDDQATPALLAQTPDNGSTAWGATTIRELTLASTVVIARTGLYYASMCAAYTGSPNIFGSSASASGLGASTLVSGQKVLATTSGSSLTATAPATIAFGTAPATIPYVTLRA